MLTFFVLGIFVGVVLSHICFVRDPFEESGCTHDCNQGRSCTCQKK